MPTPVWPYSWPSKDITFKIDSGTTYYNAAASRWNNATNVTMTSGDSDVFIAKEVNAGETGWDGISQRSSSGSEITGCTVKLNTFYTSQEKYTEEIIKGIATHEFGHALGLKHSDEGPDKTIMYPNTFSADKVRVTTPQQPDIEAINGKYSSGLQAAPLDVDTEYSVITPHYTTNYEGYICDADVIVEGIVESAGDGSEHTFGDDKDTSLIYTDFDINVKVVYDGSIPCGMLTVHQMGGKYGGKEHKVEGSTPFTIGQRVLLHLRWLNGHYYLINEDEGVHIKQCGHEYVNVKTNNKMHKLTFLQQLEEIKNARK
ncbi:M57 family metalloprotease [Longirhabdus pacifica]|uniref:M57 family metalloprotease n=1 Tax=Longirhabdus pacifica TaxID=2305227 RepID=UPI0013E8F19E|nr:M57 family metalloprotease [Longirhabdus pacifica]